MSYRGLALRLCMALGIVFVMWTASASASSTHDFVSSFGTGTESIAVDESSENVYALVPGSGGGSLLKYDLTGKPAAFTALAGQPDAIENLHTPLSGESEVAVDNSTGPDKGDIYIAASGTNGEKIDIFSPGGQELGTLSEQASVAWGETCGVAVDSTGAVYVAIYGGYIDKFVPKGGTLTNADFTSTLAGANEPCSIAADSQGDVFASKWENGPVFRYEASQFGSLSATSSLVDATDNSVAVDPHTDHVYVKESNQIAEYGARGEPLTEPIGIFANVGEGAIAEGFGIAVDGITGDVYVSNGNGGINIYGPDVITPTVTTENASSLETKSATLNGTVNPEGVQVTACEFEYGTTQSYGQKAPCATSPGSGDVPVQVTAAISGLQRETEYHFRLVAANANGESLGDDQALETPAPVVTGQVTDLGTTSATLVGKVNPEGSAVTTCEFKYGTTAEYGQSVSCGKNPGSGESGVGVTAQVASLLPHTTYHFELVVIDGEGEQVGGNQTFVTGSLPAVTDEGVTNVSGSSATMVATINPKGWDTTYHFEFGPTSVYGDSAPVPDTDIGGTEEEHPVALHVQGLESLTMYHYRVVASDTYGVTYGPDKTFVTQSTGAKLTLLDGRQWELVSPPNKHGAGITAMPAGGGIIEASEQGQAITYLANSPVDGSVEGNRAPEWLQVMAGRSGGAWVNQMIVTPHEESYPLFIGHGSEYLLFSADLTSAVLEPRGATPLSPETTDVTPYLRDGQACETDPSHCYVPLVTAGNVPPGTKFGVGVRQAGHGSEAEPVGASSDLKHVILTAHVPLTSSNVEDGLYEWTAGALSLISVLPESEGGDGVAADLGRRTGPNISDVRNAVSSDGSRVIWTASAGGEHLYLRDAATGETVRLDEIQPGGTNSVSPIFQTASADGSRVFFTDSGKLTADSGEGDLYECDIVERPGGLHCELTDITGAPIEQSVVGASDDGSYIYFVSNAILASGAAAGSNLYVSHSQGAQWATEFIGKVSAEDAEHLDASNLVDLTARVSSNGRFVAFMSENSLTGYDNLDATTGERDEEVYIYDASRGSLTCASCDPTGARPHGIHDDDPELLSDRVGAWSRHSLAADIPGWTGANFGSAAFYQTRYLSDDGRLFFNATDALVPQDTNGFMDVYEYEPDGAGDCARSAGCVGLLSSGDSGEESAFMDASASGDDVFFLTKSRLTAEDTDTAFDIYDAHVCSVSVPCVSEPVSPPACDTSDSCKAAPTLQPASFGAPASQTFSGAGNVPAGAAVKPTGRKAGLTSAQKLARALRECAKKRGKKARTSCRKRARQKLKSTRVKRGR
jgi:hypothetical protein